MEEEGTVILAENIQNKSLIRKIPSQTEEHKQNLRRKMELNMWIGIICHRMFFSDVIQNIQISEKVANLFLFVNSQVLCCNNKDELISLIKMPNHLILQESYN
jgi:hypothetical protein